MHQRIRRQLVIGLATVVATGLIAIAPANADTDAVGRAQATLDQIQEQAARIDSDYTKAQAALEEAEGKLKQAKVDIVKQTQRLDVLKADLTRVAIVSYQTHGVSMTARLLASPDESSFLNSLATLNSVAERTNGQVQDVQVEQAKLDRLRADAADYTAKAKSEKDKQAALVKEYDAKEKRSKDVLDGLKAEERARLLATQEARARAARAAVAQVPTAPAPGDPLAPKPGEPGDGTATGRAQGAVDWGRTQVGRPYRFGSAGPGSYDCSGFTSAAFRRIGIELPRTSQTQFRVGTSVSRNDLQPGDLLFFYGGITHVGIYVGNGVMVHSSPSGRGVHYSNLATYPSYQGARRVV